MFGAFRITSPLSGGLLWKTPWRLSKFQKRRQRMRLRAVDSVVATLDAALAKKGETLESVERWKREMPTEAEMVPRDKYSIFDRKVKGYRKGIHSEFFSRVATPEVDWFERSADGLRTAEVDEGLAAGQPARLLRRGGQGEREELGGSGGSEYLERMVCRTAGDARCDSNGKRWMPRDVGLVQYVVYRVFLRGKANLGLGGCYRPRPGKHRRLHSQWVNEFSKTRPQGLKLRLAAC